ncbi:hypothetical protein AHAS_Ahas20G0185800 [Arachis hypogaea]
MEFNSSCDQTNFMGYYPPSPISNDGWEYYQEFTDPEHSNLWRYVSKPQDEQEDHMGYFSPLQNDSSHCYNGGWEYHQEFTDSEQPNQWGYASENDQGNFKRYYPPPQDDLCNHPHGGWEYQQGIREYEQSSEMNYFPEPQSDSYCYDTDINHGWEGNFKTEQEILFKKMNGHLEQMRRNLELLSKEAEEQLVDVKEEMEEQDEKAFVSSEFLVKKEEVVEVFEPKHAYPQQPLGMTREYENSQPPQTSLNQKVSTIESVIERYEEEMEKSWEEQQISSMKVLLSQILSAKEEVEE